MVVDPLHVPHAEAYTAGGSAGAEFVVLPCLQRGLVLPVIRHGVEQVRTGNACGVLSVHAAIERPPDILVGRLVRPYFVGDLPSPHDATIALTGCVNLPEASVPYTITRF